MIILNSKKLLDEISSLELQISVWEQTIKSIAPEYDCTELLEKIINNYLNK